jgi:hypothetical protein
LSATEQDLPRRLIPVTEEQWKEVHEELELNQEIRVRVYKVVAIYFEMVLLK